MAEPTICTCEDWGARKPHTSSFPTHLAQKIVIHNTQGANRAAGADLHGEEQLAFQMHAVFKITI